MKKGEQVIAYTIDGQTATPEGVQDGDIIGVEYYVDVPAQNWFDVACDKMGDGELNMRDLTSLRLSELLVEMGAVEGEVVV